jgi:hypothetical protein
MANRSHIRRPLVILMALAGPVACTPPVTQQQQPQTFHVEVHDFPPTGKSEYEQESDRANCKNAHRQDAVAFAHCLMALGYGAELAMAPGVVLYSTSNPGVPYPSGPVAPLPNAAAQTVYQPPQEYKDANIAPSPLPTSRPQTSGGGSDGEITPEQKNVINQL